MLKALCVAVLLLAASPAFAQTADEVNQQIDALLGPHEIYETAIATIEDALAEHDVTAVAGYIAFGEPIKVNGEDVVIADETDLTARFDELFPEKVVTAVVGQDYAKLLVNADGIMFGDGELWISGICDDDACEFPFVNIIAINNE